MELLSGILLLVCQPSKKIMIRGSYQNRCDRLPICQASFAFACRECHHSISLIIRSCCDIHCVFPSSITVIRSRSPRRLRAALLGNSFFIIWYNNCVCVVVHCALSFAVSEVGGRTKKSRGRTRRGKKRKCKRATSRGKGALYVPQDQQPWCSPWEVIGHDFGV